MIRKLAIALGATMVLGAAALAPTTASAWGHGHRHNGFYGGYGFYGPTLHRRAHLLPRQAPRRNAVRPALAPLHGLLIGRAMRIDDPGIAQRSWGFLF
jgi:hypothetical protein